MGDVNPHVEEFLTKLRRRQVEGSQYVAKETALLLRQVISHLRVPASNQAGVLLDAVRSVGLRLVAASPTELAIGNVVRRVLRIIREEEAGINAGLAPKDLDLDLHDEDNGMDGDGREGSGEEATTSADAYKSTLKTRSLYNLLEFVPNPMRGGQGGAASSHGDSDGISRAGKGEKAANWKAIKTTSIEGINELLLEIENFSSEVAEQALEHIHQNEVILTFGRSRTLKNFLLEAKKKRSFQVVVAEGCPRYDGHVLTRELSAAGLQTVCIPDSAVFAMMARVNMVIVAAHAVMANGGVVAPVGLHLTALAAQKHAVPFVVLAGMFKLCPLYPHDPSTMLNDMKSPAEILDFGEFSDCLNGATGVPRVQVDNPTFDYIPPELVSLFITDRGGHNPSYVYRLVSEYYSPEDYVL